MKKTLLFLLIATLVLSTVALVACGEAPSISFVAPTNVEYMVGDTLDLAGGKLVTYFADGTTEEQALTNAMLDATTLPNMDQAGTYTVKGSVENFDFSFQITVHANPDVVAFVSPAKLDYKAGETMDLTGASITINGTKYDITADMLDATTLPNMSTEGDYLVKGSKNGKNFSFTVSVKVDIQVKVADGYVYQRTQDIVDQIQVRTLNADGKDYTDCVAKLTARRVF